MPGDEGGRSVITELGCWPLDGLDGREIRLLTVEYAAGVHTPPHRHPGWQAIYVLDGTVVSQMEGEPASAYSSGEHWFEPRQHLHVDIGNDQPRSSAKILVCYVTEPGQPVLIPEPSDGAG